MRCPLLGRSVTACLISPLGIRAGGGLSYDGWGRREVRSMLMRYANTWSEVLTGMEGGNLNDGMAPEICATL